MIEMRWVEREVEVYKEFALGHGWVEHKIERILQYRQTLETDIYFADPDNRMTPWTDVPVVKEDV
jgi:hypothetical protein